MTTTPTKNESLPELVSGWRKIAGPPEKTLFGSEASKTFSQVLHQCADELEAALTREAPTEGVDVEALHAIVRSWEGGQSAIESMAQVSATIGQATPPAPQRLAQGEDVPDWALAKAFREVSCNDAEFSASRDTAFKVKFSIWKLAKQLAASDGCGACGDACADRPNGCEVAEHSPPTQPPHQDRGEVERHARDLLAKAYRDGGFPHAASVLLEGRTDSLDECALAALAAALTEAKQQGPGEAEPMPVAFMTWNETAGKFQFTRHAKPGSEALYPRPTTYRAAPQVEAKRQTGDATDADIQEWLERHDLEHAIRGTDARAAFEDAQTFAAAAKPSGEE